MNALLRLLGINSEFERLFYQREYRTLAGERQRIILALIAILFFTLLALGYAVGSIENLGKKMNNPFTNWVDLSITEDYVAKKSRDIETYYTEEEQKENFQLADVRGWVIFNLEMYRSDFNPILHPIDSLSYATWGRSIDADDPLLQKIVAEDNLLWKSPALNLQEEGLSNCEIIITEEMLDRLDFDTRDPEVGYVFVRESDLPMPIQVVGVVRELPKFCNFISSPQFYNIKNAKRDGFRNCADLMQVTKEGDNNFAFLVDSQAEAEALKQLGREFFTNGEPPEIQITEQLTSGSKEWSICELSFFPTDSPSLDSIDQFLDLARQRETPIGRVVKLECSSDICDLIAPENYYYLAFNFNRLNFVRNFKDSMKEEHDVDIDMSQVEAKENFALVSQLTFVISLILLGFGVLSIMFFVNNLLRSHLFKVRSNLGTFKAFGLSNRFLTLIYLKIIFSFLVVSIFIAFGGTVLVDIIEHSIMKEESRFNIFSSWILIAITTLVIVSLIISTRTTKQILGDTPGNLIYGR